MALEGDLRFFRLPDILQVISQQQKTGILTVQGDQDILAVSFLRGDVVAADALNQNFERGLGEVLASQGLLRPEQFDRLIEDQKSSGQRLADFLVERGALDRGQLLEALRQLTYRLLLQVLRWRQGEFKFYSGDEVSYEEGFVSLPVAEVLMRSLGDLMGEGTLSGALPHGFVPYEKCGLPGAIRVIGRDGAPPSEPSDEHWVSVDELTLLEALDGRKTADAIAKSTGLGEYKTLYGLFRLMQAGLVRPAGGAAAVGLDVAEVAEELEPDAPPPEPRRVASRQRAEEAEPTESERAETREAWLGQLLGAAAAIAAGLVVALALLRPAAIFLPFPWLRQDRTAFDRQQRIARTLVIDRSARTYFLIEGRYPDQLSELVERGLLAERLRFDVSGRPYQYRPDSVSYLLESPRGTAASSMQATTESIAGDFVVDPEFFRGLRDDESIPLILLD